MAEKAIGPCLPPAFANQNLDDSEEEIIGPKLPPQIENYNEAEDDQDFGPALPPGFLSSSSPTIPSFDNSDDEFIGPVPEGQDDKNHQYDPSVRLSLNRSKSVSKRENWMLEPPKALKKTLQIKSVTQFSQRSSKIKDVPLTKEQKLELDLIKEKESKMKDFIDKYETKDKKRSTSLLEQHRTNFKNHNKKVKTEIKERREFDREKDLNIPRIDGKKKNAFIREASSTFSDKFSSGKFEKFL